MGKLFLPSRDREKREEDRVQGEKSGRLGSRAFAEKSWI